MKMYKDEKQGSKRMILFIFELLTNVKHFGDFFF